MSTKYISSILYDDTLDDSSYLNDLPVIKYLKEVKKQNITKPSIIKLPRIF